jgi:SLT domain-containing protein
MLPADRLDAALAALRRAAREGRLDAFDTLAAQVSQAIAAMEQSATDARRLQALRRSAQDTAAILQAVRQGLDAARHRLAELETLRQGLGTYGDDGRRRQLQAPGRTERRI